MSVKYAGINNKSDTAINALHKLLTDSRIGIRTPFTVIRHTEKPALEIVPAESQPPAAG